MPIVTYSFGSRSAATGGRPATHGSRGVRGGGPPASAEIRRDYNLFCAVIASVIIIALSWCAFVQTSYWKNSETLWNHALAVTADNDAAHNNLGYLFLQRGELDNAISHFETALKIRSRNAAGHYNFGGALIENNLANALARRGLVSEAVGHYEKAVKLRPGYGDPYLNLGTVLFQQGRIVDAIAQWQMALATQPNDAGFHTAKERCQGDRKSTRLNSSHGYISYAVFCLKKKNNNIAAKSLGDRSVSPPSMRFSSTCQSCYLRTCRPGARSMFYFSLRTITQSRMLIHRPT